MEIQLEEDFKQNTGLEFNTHVCLQCKSCVEGVDQYVVHIKNGCSIAEEEEQNILEEYKKREHQLKKELSTLKINVVEKEGQLKDIQNKILRHERTGHKVKTAQLKIRSEEVAISKKEMKQLKLKYNKLLCYLKEHEHEIDQSEKRGDTPEKKYLKSPKGEKKSNSSKISSVKFSNKTQSPEKRREIPKEKNRLIIQNSLFKRSKKDKKEQTKVLDAARNLLNPTTLACSETVCTNLKESSVVGINPKQSKTNKNECIKEDKYSFTNKIKHCSNKQEKSFILEPISDVETETNKRLDTQDELSLASPLINIKQNVAGKAKDSLDLYRKSDKSYDDTADDAQSSRYKSIDDGTKINEPKDLEENSEEPLQPILKKEKSVDTNSQYSTIEFINSQQSINIVDSEVDNGKPTNNLGKSIKPILKAKIVLSKVSECPTNVIKVENVEYKSQPSTNSSNTNNNSVVFLKQIQLPPNNEISVLPRVSTPICKEQKLDFVDPDLSAIISGEEVSHGIDESVYILSTDNAGVPTESRGYTQKRSEVRKETEGFVSIKKEKIITQRVNDKVNFKDVSFEQKLKNQAKDESFNEAILLETDLDNEVCTINNNSNVSIYSPQDPIETLSFSGSEFLTVSEASKSSTKADLTIKLPSENRLDSDKAVVGLSKSENSDTLKIDGEYDSTKASDVTPLFVETSDLQKQKIIIEKKSDKLENYNNIKTLAAAPGKTNTEKTSNFTPLSKESSGPQRQKITMEKKADQFDKSDNVDALPTATVKPLNTSSNINTKYEAPRSDKRKLLPEGMGSREKRTRINVPNGNDQVWHPSNNRRGGNSSAVYKGDRFRRTYDPNHHPRPGILRVPYQQPNHPPWHPRGTNNYRPRMNNQNHYNWNYRW